MRLSLNLSRVNSSVTIIVTLSPVLLSLRTAVADLPSVAISILDMAPTIFKSSAQAVLTTARFETAIKVNNMITNTIFFILFFYF